MLARFALLFLTLYCVFPFYFKSIHFFQSVLTYGLASLYFFILFITMSSGKTTLGKVKVNIFSILLICVYLSLVIFSSIVTQSSDFTYFLSYASLFRQLLLMLLPFSVVYFNQRRHGSFEFETYVFLFVRAVSVYVFFSLVLLIPQFREFWNGVIYITDRNSELVDSVLYYARYGLQGFSGFRHAFLSAISVLFCSLIYVINKKSGRDCCYLVKYFVLSLMGCFIYGRIGIASILFASPFLSLFMAIELRKLSLLFIFVTVVLVISFLIYIYIDDIVQFSPAFSWILEPIVNLAHNGDLTTKSTQELESMYFMPNDKTIFIGDGRYTNLDGSYYMHTDVGFMRPLLYHGVFPLVFYYLVGFLPLLNIYLKTRVPLLYLLSIVIIVAAFESKGEILFSYLAVFLPFFYFPVIIAVKNKIQSV